MLRIIKGLAVFAIAFLVLMPAISAQAATGLTTPCSPSRCLPPTPPPPAQSSNEGTPPGDPVIQDNAAMGGGKSVDYYTRESKMVTIKASSLKSLESMAEKNYELQTEVTFLSIFLALAVIGLIGTIVAAGKPRK